ncbi:MAG: hypothetical protein ACRECO_07920 [Xanthobacteraceae bacterium]
MLIRVTANRSVLLEEHDNFRAFKVVVESRRDDLPAVCEALKDIAVLDDADTAWVSELALRSWASVAADVGWQQALTGMIEKARPHGWIDDSRRAIKAHVEWVG